MGEVHRLDDLLGPSSDSLECLGDLLSKIGHSFLVGGSSALGGDLSSSRRTILC